MANCDNFAILEITDGTTSVDLLNEENGFLLSEWMPNVADFKDGGIFQNSPLAAGRRLVAYRYANATETMQMKAHHASADALIEESQTLRRLLQKAADYWATDWQNTPVYVKGRARGETNTRYCLIHTGRLGNDANPYAQPFIQAIRPGAAVMDDIPLIFERGHWLENAPGSTSGVTISSTQSWVAPEDWEAETTTPSGDVKSLLQTANGDLYAGTDDTAKLYKSTDNGVTWALNTTFGGAASDSCNALIEATVGGTTYILAGVSGGAAEDGIYRSTDDGSSWTGPFDGGIDVYSFVDASFVDRVHAGGSTSATGNGAIYTSLNPAGSWVNRDSASISDVRGIVEIPSTGALIYIAGDDIYSISFDFTALPGTNEVNHGSGVFHAIYRLISERIIAGMDNGVVYYSDDDGSTWSTATTTLTSGVYSFVQDSNTGFIYAGGSSQIWISFDDGDVWYSSNAEPSTTVAAMLQKADSDLYASDDGQILVLNPDKYTSTTEHVINSRPLAEITNIKKYDASGPTYTDLFPDSSLPYELWPTSANTSDFVYIGVHDEYGALSFSNVVFNFTTPGVQTFSDVTPQYYNGSWVTLSAKDNTIGDAGSFSKTGQWSFSWEIPSSWTTVTIDGDSALWIRFSTWAGDTPEQGTYDVYTMRNAHVEVAASAIAGDLPALLNMGIEVASDEDGPGGSAPDGYINRALIGLRSVSRGSLYQAYLNASDQGNDPNLLVTAGTDTTFADDIRAPTNRRMEYAPASTGSWVSSVTFTLQGDLVKDYYGTFHVFLRLRQSGGSAGDVDFRLRTSTGSGGLEIDTRSKTLTTTNDHQFIDFGRLTIPVSSLLNSDETGDEAKIVVQCNASSMTPTIHFYDLVLLPIDEWAGDFTDKENSSTSPLTGGYYLDVDSATFPKRSIRAQVRDNDNNRIKSVYQPVVNGEAILQANAQQRLWFMFARTASAGSSDWRSEPWMAAKITLAANQRYLGMRGAR